MLEKHADFLRDFRGDTIHPSTLELMHELGLAGRFSPSGRITRCASSTPQFGDERVTVADFSHLPTQCKFIALHAAVGLPQLRRRARQALPGFSSDDGDRGRRPHRGKRPRGGRARSQQVRCDGDSRGSRRRHRRPPFDGARQSWVRGDESRRPDGCAMDANFAGAERSGTDIRPYRCSGGFSSCSSAATIGSARLSFAREASTEIQRAWDSKRSAADLAALAPYLGDRVNEIDGLGPD